LLKDPRRRSHEEEDLWFRNYYVIGDHAVLDWSSWYTIDVHRTSRRRQWLLSMEDDRRAFVGLVSVFQYSFLGFGGFVVGFFSPIFEVWWSYLLALWSLWVVISFYPFTIGLEKQFPNYVIYLGEVETWMGFRRRGGSFLVSPVAVMLMLCLLWGWCVGLVFDAY